MDESGWITRFLEKPPGEDLRLMVVFQVNLIPRAYFLIEFIQNITLTEESLLLQQVNAINGDAMRFRYAASMGIYLFKADVLLKLLRWHKITHSFSTCPDGTYTCLILLSPLFHKGLSDSKRLCIRSNSSGCRGLQCSGNFLREFPVLYCSLHSLCFLSAFLLHDFPIWVWLGLPIWWILGRHWDSKVLLWCQLKAHRTGMQLL